MSKYYLVGVKNITSKVPRSTFDVDKLEQIARSIIAAGGLLTPLLLKQTDIRSYEVLSGNLEYYAAVRAKEISPEKAEMVNAFVVPDKVTEDAVEQLKILHPASMNVTTEVANPADKNIGSGQIVNLEARIDEFMRDFKQMRRQDMQSIETSVKNLQEQLPKQMEPLEVLNNASISELSQEMANARMKNADKIIRGIEKARKESPFTSFKDVIKRVNGLAERGMITIIDSWVNKH